MSRHYVPASAEALPTEPDRVIDTPDEESTMIIKFESVLLHKAVARLDAGKGQASHSTQAFNTKDHGVTIELDTASGLVRIAKGTATVHVPREGVERFGPTLEEAAAHRAALETIAVERRKANDSAEANAAAIAAIPA